MLHGKRACLCKEGQLVAEHTFNILFRQLEWKSKSSKMGLMGVLIKGEDKTIIKWVFGTQKLRPYPLPCNN